MKEEIIQKKKYIIQKCIEENILLPADLLNKTDDQKIEKFYQNLISNNISPDKILSLLKEGEKREPNINIICSYPEEPKKKSVQDFVSYFKTRFECIESLLKQREEFNNVLSIRRVPHRADGDSVAVIGIVYEKEMTKNNNILITLEDPTGFIKIIINKNRPELYKFATDILLDEIIGVVGKKSRNIIFVDTIRSPDIPLKPLKKSPDEAYAIVLSDIEFGSSIFMEEEFNHFLQWIRGERGNEKHKHIAKLTKYIFIVGDLVAGVGVYPKQEEELSITSIYKQYEQAAFFLSKIPEDKHIIICPGNHDSVRIAEPQPALLDKYSEALQEIPNVILISNPGIVRIHESEDFSGFDVLLYHGFSYSYYSDAVTSIRESEGSVSDRTEKVMKYLLQKRHLAPTYTSNQFNPIPNKDPLFIEKVPDFFFSGHIHKFRTVTYRNTLIVCGSCWNPKTANQEKLGHTPEPCKIPVIHLHDRSITLLNFQK